MQPNGYGKIQRGRSKIVGAHRAAWLLYRGEIPNGLIVCHKCDQPKCVNPDHLFLGTIADNNRDSWEKGRYAARFRRMCARNLHALTPDNVRLIGGERRCGKCWKARLAREVEKRAALTGHTPRGRGACRHGHAMTEANSMTDKHGVARCRTCHNAKSREWKARQRMENR